MADVSDVTAALAAQVSSILAPVDGVAAITGAVVKIYPGWPDSATLEADLADGICHVSVFAKPADTQDFVAMTGMGWSELPNDGVNGEVERSVRRQTKVFTTTVWANTPTARDALAKAIDGDLAGLVRMALPDGTNAPLSYKGSLQRDEMQKAMIYRRDLNYAVTFDTLQTQTGYVVLYGETNAIGGPADDPGPPVTKTVQHTSANFVPYSNSGIIAALGL